MVANDVLWCLLLLLLSWGTHPLEGIVLLWAHCSLWLGAPSGDLQILLDRWLNRDCCDPPMLKPLLLVTFKLEEFLNHHVVSNYHSLLSRLLGL